MRCLAGGCYGFYFTILFAAAYLVNYHVLPRPLIGRGHRRRYDAAVLAAGRGPLPAAGAGSGPACR